MSLQGLPAEVLHLIMALLPPNAAVLLGGLHPELRAALATLPELHAALTLDAVDRCTAGTPRTRARSPDATSLLLRRQRESFSSFMAASPRRRVTWLELTLRLPPTLAQAQLPPGNAALNVDWLPLSSIRQLALSAKLPPGGYSTQWRLYSWLHRCLHQIVSACSALQHLTLVCDSEHSSLWFDAYQVLDGCLPAGLPCLELRGSGCMWLTDCRRDSHASALLVTVP